MQPAMGEISRGALEAPARTAHPRTTGLPTQHPTDQTRPAPHPAHSPTPCTSAPASGQTD